MSVFSENLTSLRRSKGLTVDQVASFMDVSADEVISLQDKMGWYNVDEQNVIEQKWDKIINILKEAPSFSECTDMLFEIGLSYSDFIEFYGIQKIKDASKKVALFRSANMSIGVNAIISAVKEVAKKLYGFDIEIIEKHHHNKVDAPSGTALMLADAVKEVMPEKFYVYGREGIVGKRNENEIGIHAVRGGSIVGEHDVIFAGESETVTISHEATDRAVFASGAVRAAIYLKDKKVGLYNMDDVLKNV